MSVLISNALAQQPGAQPGAVAVEEPTLEQGTTISEFFRRGGILMWPLGLLSVATIALTTYGFLVIPERKMLAPHLIVPLTEALNRCDVEEANRLCRETPSMLTNVLSAGLDRISDGVLDVESMDKAMEEASIEETSTGLKMISYLSVSAQLAPMLGLLGTVSGMIQAFDKIGAGGMGRPELLADNIGEAMITTAVGLVIGIPAMFFYFYLKSGYSANVTRMGRILGNLSHHLVAATRKATAATAEV